MTQSRAGLADFDEIRQFGQALHEFRAGHVDADRFTATRLQMGVYGQRQEGFNMVRVKLPGGTLDAEQIEAMGEVLERHVRHDVVHITTRQDIQLHHVPLNETPEVLHHLAGVGLTTREACGNTIRNVSACPLAGVCPREHTDVNVHLLGTVQHFLRNPLNQQLPRKFKMSFSGCETDCSQAMLHDLGVVATRSEGRNGFKVLAGGGLGHKPHAAIVVEPFVEEHELIAVVEAVVALHSRYSDRTKRAKSRIKFLVDRFGAEGFVAKYREEFARSRAALATAAAPRGEWREGSTTAQAPGPGAPREVLAQRQAELSVVPISVPAGNLRADQLRGIAQAMRGHGIDTARATQDQNLVLLNVPSSALAPLLKQLEALGLALPRVGDNVVACPGTTTCRLGITASPSLAPKLDGGPHDLRIRVSGCHNGCAQPETGDIGLYGEGKRMHGRLVPHYQFYFGGDGLGGGGLGLKGPSVPSMRAEQAIERVKNAYTESHGENESFFQWTRRVGKPSFDALLADLLVVTPEQVAALSRDHGDERDFRVYQFGGGECAGASQLSVGTQFFEAAHERNYRDAFRFQRKLPEALKCAEVIAQSIAKALSQLAGGKAIDSAAGQAAELRRVLPQRADLGDWLDRLQSDLASATEDDELSDAAAGDIFASLDAWTRAAAEHCMDVDRQLDLGDTLPRAPVRAQTVLRRTEREPEVVQ